MFLPLYDLAVEHFTVSTKFGLTKRPSMSNGNTPVIKSGDSIEYTPVNAASGLSKGVLLDERDGAPHFALRRFTLAAQSEVPAHTNEVEHEQYVLDGTYLVGIRDPETGEETEHVVSAGDAILIPAGTVHWYRNETDTAGAFLCAVPHGEDSIELVTE